MRDAESEGPWKSCDSLHSLIRQNALGQMELWFREGSESESSKEENWERRKSRGREGGREISIS